MGLGGVGSQDLPPCPTGMLGILNAAPMQEAYGAQEAHLEGCSA